MHTPHISETIETVAIGKSFVRESKICAKNKELKIPKNQSLSVLMRYMLHINVQDIILMHIHVHV